jgi:hypothetical protein
MPATEVQGRAPLAALATWTLTAWTSIRSFGVALRMSHSAARVSIDSRGGVAVTSRQTYSRDRWTPRSGRGRRDGAASPQLVPDDDGALGHEGLFSSAGGEHSQFTVPRAGRGLDERARGEVGTAAEDMPSVRAFPFQELAVPGKPFGQQPDFNVAASCRP